MWGRMVPTPAGTRVVVTMRMHLLTMVFMLFWFGGVGFAALTENSAHSASLWGMFLFGVALCTVGFVPEAMKAKRLLSSILSTPV